MCNENKGCALEGVNKSYTEQAKAEMHRPSAGIYSSESQLRGTGTGPTDTQIRVLEDAILRLTYKASEINQQIHTLDSQLRALKASVS
jgi:uncharacterized protein YbaP (TraB family)